MLFFLTGFLLVVRCISSPVETTAWFSAPNFRGTWDLLVGCILTLIICVWSALHLNVPKRNSTLRTRNLRRAKWILLGIFAPELVVSSAFAEYLTARWLRREILQDIAYRKAKGADRENQEWSITQCYFAIMGGITVQAGNCVDGNPRLSLTPEGLRLLSFLGRLPRIHESQIRDKSKADGLAKTIVCLQAGWMVLQTIARLAQHLPITLLEINTNGHVLCALALYLLWWSKPLEVKDPILLPHEEWMDPYISLMWMCSPISGSKDDEISEMRCMAYSPPNQRQVVDIPAVTVEANAVAEPLRTHETHFSLGSTGARDPRKFIGPLGDFHIGSQDRSRPSIPFDHSVSYEIKKQNLPIATEHEIFFQLQGPHHTLRHGKQYCRRAFPDCHTHEPLSDSAIQRWRHASLLIDELWTQCEKRPSYMSVYFTTSTLGIFVGELGYISTHVPNIFGIAFNGAISIRRDRLKSVLAFAAAAYGAPHIAAWNEHFPTPIERLLWIISSVAIGSSGVILLLFFLVKQKIQPVDVVGNRIGDSRGLKVVWRYGLLPLFVLARAYLVVEAFVSLRRLPTAAYKTPQWSNFFPHL